MTTDVLIRTPPRARVYYGWSIVLVAAAAMVGTLPGRTQGLGLITEPLLADLGFDRVSYATLNLWATLLGAGGALGIGRVLDRAGSRVVLTTLAIALGIVVSAMSFAASFAALAIGITLTRVLGQSALSVVSLAMVGQWFRRRLDTAMAVYSIVMSIGFMIAFPVVGSLIQSIGWRRAWLVVGLALIAGLAPLGFALARRSPESCGLVIDGEKTRTAGGAGFSPPNNEPAEPIGRAPIGGAGFSPPDPGTEPEPLDGYTWQTAIRFPAFWIFASGAALYGLVASGIGLFNESILAERGFDVAVYYQTLVVTALTALAGNFLGGWLAAYVRLTTLLAVSLAVLALGLAGLPHVVTLGQVMTWAAAMGLGGGLVMVLFFSVWPRVFGRRHLGRIQGIAQAMTVLASAVGPLLLAWWVERTGSYATMFRMLAVAIAAMAIAAWMVRLPAPQGPADAAEA